MNRTLTCIICPAGCALTVHQDNERILSVAGNACPRGRIYAESECIAPVRTVTSTVRCRDGASLRSKPTIRSQKTGSSRV